MDKVRPDSNLHLKVQLIVFKQSNKLDFFSVIPFLGIFLIFRTVAVAKCQRKDTCKNIHAHKSPLAFTYTKPVLDPRRPINRHGF